MVAIGRRRGVGRRRAVAAVAVVVSVLAAVVLTGVLGDLLDRGPDGPSGAPPSYPVRASPDGASLVDADGDPFLYLADTVWLAPSRLDEDGMRDLLDVRAEQGFTTVQASVLPFVHLPGGLQNVRGDAAVDGMDLAEPLESDGDDYWDHLDTFVTLAAERGLQVTLVPSWYGFRGEDWRGYVDVDSARTYGRFLGERLGHHPNLMWLLGGDNRPVGDVDRVPDGARTGDVLDATRQMARAIRESEAVPHLMSYHASRGVDSVELFGDDDWHTFVSAYSGELTWRNVSESSGTGVPVVLTEAYYDGREQFTLVDRRELRAQAWWSVLGGAGFAYGHEDVWDLDPGHGPESDGGADSWRDALTAPSAGDITVLADTVRDLVPLRPADDDVLVGDPGDGASRVSAALSADGRTAVVYVPEPRRVEVDLGAVGGDRVTLAWLDPADGSERAVDPPDGDRAGVRPPDGLADAVLVIRAEG